MRPCTVLSVVLCVVLPCQRARADAPLPASSHEPSSPSLSPPLPALAPPLGRAWLYNFVHALAPGRVQVQYGHFMALRLDAARIGASRGFYLAQAGLPGRIQADAALHTRQSDLVAPLVIATEHLRLRWGIYPWMSCPTNPAIELLYTRNNNASPALRLSARLADVAQSLPLRYAAGLGVSRDLRGARLGHGVWLSGGAAMMFAPQDLAVGFEASVSVRDRNGKRFVANQVELHFGPSLQLRFFDRMSLLFGMAAGYMGIRDGDIWVAQWNLEPSIHVTWGM